MAGNDDDVLEFADEQVLQSREHEDSEPWLVLVVDDDEDVHAATRLALLSCRILGRPLELLHARSAAEALSILKTEENIAAILLDVVMESHDSGLKAVRAIREDLGIFDTRIILRTGQPGQAPELDTISRYDINDYKTKGELTRDRLITTLIAAVRSYDQIRRIERSRQGLEKIVAASNHLMERQGLENFAEGVITQISGLLGVKPEGIVCVGESSGPDGKTECRVIAAAGKYTELMRLGPCALKREDIKTAVHACLEKKKTLLGERNMTLYFASRDGKSFATYIDSANPIKEVDSHLLKVFCSNLSLSAENIGLVDRLKQRAYEDSVVGLPNMSALLEAIETGECAGSRRTLALLDIDQFGNINDVLGHSYGDKILKATAERLRKEFTEACMVARVAADEFGILGDADFVTPERIHSALGEALVVEGDKQRLSVSIGLVSLDKDEQSGGTILKNAHIALKRAQAAGIGQVVRYSDHIGAETRERSRLLGKLRAAFERQQLSLAFQPQLSLPDRRLVGFEALIRWKSEEGKLVPPDSFIPVAEYSGLIVPMGEWILRAALLARKHFEENGIKGIRMAVNISAIQLNDAAFLQTLDQALKDFKIDGPELELEITESVSVMGITGVSRLFEEIKKRGVLIAIDDFGTGYSSLSSIDRWPADRLKIDKSFVSGLDSEGGRTRIVDLIVPLGKRLSMDVLAEGVETEKEFNYLVDLGCAEAQGYLFGKPMYEKEVLEWFEKQ